MSEEQITHPTGEESWWTSNIGVHYDEKKSLSRYIRWYLLLSLTVSAMWAATNGRLMPNQIQMLEFGSLLRGVHGGVHGDPADLADAVLQRDVHRRWPDLAHAGRDLGPAIVAMNLGQPFAAVVVSATGGYQRAWGAARVLVASATVIGAPITERKVIDA